MAEQGMSSRILRWSGRWKRDLTDLAEAADVRADQGLLGVAIEAGTYQRIVLLLMRVMIVVEDAQGGHVPGIGMAAQLGELPHPAGGDHVPYQPQLLLQRMPVELPEVVLTVHEPGGLFHGQVSFRQGGLPQGGAVIDQGGVHQVHAHIDQEGQVGGVGHTRGVYQLGTADLLPQGDQGLRESSGVTPELESPFQHDDLRGRWRRGQANLVLGAAYANRELQSVAGGLQDRSPVQVQP